MKQKTIIFPKISQDPSPKLIKGSQEKIEKNEFFTIIKKETLKPLIDEIAIALLDDGNNFSNENWC